jgi:hypothetical protein
MPLLRAQARALVEDEDGVRALYACGAPAEDEAAGKARSHGRGHASAQALADAPALLDLRLGWNEEGLAVRGAARGVGAARWCQPTRPEDSDGLHLWIATRPTGESHRAGRFCRRLVLMPTGGGRSAEQPVAVAAAIPRSSEVPAELPAGAVSIEGRLDDDGWLVTACIGAAALPGIAADGSSLWRRDAANPTLPNNALGTSMASDPRVYFYFDDVQGVWVLLYFCNGGTKTGGACICVAFSDDQRTWVPASTPLYVNGGHPAGLDKCHAHKAWLKGDGKTGRLYLYYTADSCHQGRGIALLTSTPL